KGLKAPDHSSIQWRAEKLPVKLDNALADSNEDVIIALDSSGIKVANRGDWIRHKWKVKRGYLKIHIAVDVKRKKILALKVTNEKVGDGRMLQPLVEEASKKTKITKTIRGRCIRHEEQLSLSSREKDRACDTSEAEQFKES
ncbi:MAG: transposase, partial [Candidatus Bathyarchaeia archaeon]